MDNYRSILAIVLAFFILLGYQYLFVAPQQEQEQGQVQEQPVVEKTAEVQQPKVPVQEAMPQAVPPEVVSVEQPAAFAEPASLPSQEGKDIVVNTSAFTAVITENGGGVKSYKLNHFNETIDADSERKELVNTESPRDLPLYFSWGVDPSRAQIPLLASDKETLKG